MYFKNSLNESVLNVGKVCLSACSELLFVRNVKKYKLIEINNENNQFICYSDYYFDN